MSKKSTARTGSEGDADSPHSELSFGFRSGDSSSCRSKRELEGGPFGDYQCENTQLHKDYFYFMYRDDTTTTEASEADDADDELYNLQNDYLEKLNNVRRRLNLIEMSDEVDRVSLNSCYNTCTITEIVDEEGDEEKKEADNAKETAHDQRLEQKDSNTKEIHTEETEDEKELITIFSWRPPYSIESFSSTNIFDVDYNPPKKKICYRQNTPRLTSVSEGNVPYYTRVGIHDDLFTPSQSLTKQNDHQTPLNTFIEAKQTQYTEEDFKDVSVRKHEGNIFAERKNINLFPEVIIKRVTQNIEDSSSRSSLSSSKSLTTSKCSRTNARESTEGTVLSLNVVEDDSDESISTTTYSTVIDSPQYKEKPRGRFERKNKISSTEKLTLWQEIQKLHSGKKDEGKISGANADLLAENKAKYCVEHGRANDDYISQYIRYRKQIERVRPWTVPFGHRVAERDKDLYTSVEFPYSSKNSPASSEDKEISGGDGVRSKKFWVKLCSCCWFKRE